MKNLDKQFKFWQFLSLTFFIISLILGISLFKARSSKQKQFTPSQKTVSLERKWNFIAFDRSGKTLKTTVLLSIVSVEKTNQIFVRNKPVRTTPDKSFLVLNLELENKNPERLYFYTSDYVRFVAEGKKLEADFKNPRLEIAPFSTKKDKLAFLIENKENKFQIQIGEVVGLLETIEISF